MSSSNQRNPALCTPSSCWPATVSGRTTSSSGTKTSSMVTWSLSAPARAKLPQNVVTVRPSLPAGMSTTASCSPGPSGRGSSTLAVSRSIERARLHGRLTPFTRIPPSTTWAVMLGARMPASGRPSAKPEASSLPPRATPSISIHSKPVPVCASSTMLAMEKWCMVVATASEGERAPSARCTRTASRALAPAPPYPVGTSRPGPPHSRNASMPGVPGRSSSISGIPASTSSSLGRCASSAARSRSRNLMSAFSDRPGFRIAQARRQIAFVTRNSCHTAPSRGRPWNAMYSGSTACGPHFSL